MSNPEQTRSARRVFPSAGITFLITLAVWAVFCWPLPQHLGSGITMSSRNIEKGNARTMIRGDHLQLLYHFWLFGDMLRGHSPYEKNIYEFNTGDDNKRVEPNTYFYPFCLTYVLGEWIGGRAFGWNLTVFLSLWLACFFTVHLLLRYTPYSGIAYLAGLVSLLLPYRWLTLLGGSPTGFCMVWIPLLMLGIDQAVRNRSIWGGIIAGFSVWMSFLGDHHVFFFVALLLVPWTLWSFIIHPSIIKGSWKSLGRTAISLSLPFIVLVATSIAAQGDSAERLEQSHMAGGRTLLEVLAFSPGVEGLINPFSSALSTQVFIGWSILILVALGCVAAVYLCRTADGRRNLMGLLFLLLGMSGIVLVALGMRGPFEGLPYRVCRVAIPHYDMIRQPGKIYCLMPFLLSVASALSLSAIWKIIPKAWIAAPIFLLTAGMVAESRLQISPTICLLRPDQPAYAAVANDARNEGEKPHVLILPLWPGDSHEASSYEYYASLYRIRMVNGYSPVVGHDYFDNIFKRYESVNVGELTRAQIEELREMGVQYILLHEDQFPDKVSPYPVAFTRERLMTHPHLKLLHQADRVWAFKITDETQPITPTSDFCLTYFPSRVFEAENLASNPVPILVGANASLQAFVRLSSMDTPLHTPPIYTTTAPLQRWMLRVRGDGKLLAKQLINGKPSVDTLLAVRTNNWAWREVRIAGLHGFGTVQLSLISAQGPVEVDLLLLTAGTWNPPAPGETLTLPAPCFFRAGYTDPKTKSVVFRADTEPEGAIFYGPFLPLEPGRYEMTFDFMSSAPDSTRLGEFRVGHRGSTSQASTPVISGRPARLTFTVDQNLPMALSFDYNREGDLDVRNITIKRAE